MLRDYVQDVLPSGEWQRSCEFEMTRRSTCMSTRHFGVD